MWPAKLFVIAFGIICVAAFDNEEEYTKDRVDALTAALLDPRPALQHYPNAREARGTGLGNFASLFNGGQGGGSMFGGGGGGGGSMLSNMFSGFSNVVDRVAQALGGPAMPKNIKQAIADGPRSPISPGKGQMAPRMTRPGPEVFRRIEERKKKVKGSKKFGGPRRKRQAVSVKAMKQFTNMGMTPNSVKGGESNPFSDDLTAILLGITNFFSGLTTLGRTPVSRINKKSEAFKQSAGKLVERVGNLPNTMFGSMRSKREANANGTTAPRVEILPVPAAMVNGKIVPVALPEELTNSAVETIPIPSAMVNGRVVPVALPEDMAYPKVENVPVPSAIVNGKVVPVAIPEELTRSNIQNIPVPSAMINGKMVPVAIPEELTQQNVETIPIPSAIVNGKVVPVALPEDMTQPQVENIPVPSAVINGRIVPVAIPEELSKQEVENIPVPSAVVNGRIVPVAIPEDLSRPEVENIPVPSAMINGRVVPVALPEDYENQSDMETIPVPSAMIRGRIVPVALPEELTRQEPETIPIPSAMVNGRIVHVAIPEDMARSPYGQPQMETIPIPSAMVNGRIVPVAIPEDMARSPYGQPPMETIPIPSAMINGRLVPVAVPQEDAQDYDEYEEIPVPSAMVNGRIVPVAIPVDEPGRPPMGLPMTDSIRRLAMMGGVGNMARDADNAVLKYSLRELAVAHQENWFTYLKSLNGSTTECHEWEFCKTARASNMYSTLVARNGAKFLSYVVAHLRDQRGKLGDRLGQAVDCCSSDNLMMAETCELHYRDTCRQSDPTSTKPTV